MNGSTWNFDPITQKDHHPECKVWRSVKRNYICNCQDLEEDERIQTYTRVQPKSASLLDPNAPHQSLASLIRAARRAGHLRPVQQYGGGHATAAAP